VGLSSANLPIGCEEAFSADGRWLATVVSSNELTVVIVDRKTGAVHRQFASAWQTFHNMPLEPGYRSPFLAGFLEDDSLVLWRYVPQKGATDTDASSVNLHLQRWSVDGEFLSEQDLGASGFGIGGRGPLTAEGLRRLWIPGGCGNGCYRGVHFEAGHVDDDGSLTLPKDNATSPVDVRQANRFLSVVGERTNQKALLFDDSGKVESQVDLPYLPNLLGPLVPDWFYARKPELSSDGQIAAIGRTRVAWVLVDTDRDWGSEIVLLNMHPLGLITTLKTGKGGIGAIAVDHRGGNIRMVGFWKERWHDLRWDERHDKWTEVTH
jgi:hypothetical protein